MAPSAIGSLAQTMPVTPAPSSRVAAACAASSEYSAADDLSARSGAPAAAASAWAAASLRFDGTWSAGPSTSPIRVCPSECRWPIACSTATASSQETRGKAEPLDRGVDQHVGSLRSASRA